MALRKAVAVLRLWRPLCFLCPTMARSVWFELVSSELLELGFGL